MKGYAKRRYRRRVVVKARFVRTSMTSSRALAQHLRYISRDAATCEADRGRVFDAMSDDVDRGEFAEAAKDDRHHFRFILSPEDGTEMADLKPFIRDLVVSMERDLGTRLEWVAAVHDNTDHPHVHMVIRGRRDDGRDLVMPRAYISHGVRERAEEIVTLELGPQSQLEKETKLARQTGADRFTDVDRSLAKLSNANGELNLAQTPIRYRSVNTARLNTLASLGLARKHGADRWQIATGFEKTLKELGNRGDIIKQMNQALKDKTDRIVAPNIQYALEQGNSLTGAVLRVGMSGEGHDEPFVMIDGLDGRVTTVRVNEQSIPEDLRNGMIVTLMPGKQGPKPSDLTISKIAAANDGVYAVDLHQALDPRSSPEFIGAHVRRLEALCRAGIVDRLTDGSWKIPGGYLVQAIRYQERLAFGKGAQLEVESWVSIGDQVSATGLTWLDEASRAQNFGLGFGDDVRSALSDRRTELVRRGLLASVNQDLSREAKAALESSGLDAIGEQLSHQLAKPYVPMPKQGAIEGVYQRPIVRPEGKFAVLDRQRSFTLVPWRTVIERARGQVISGMIRGRNVSWSFGRGKERSF